MNRLDACSEAHVDVARRSDDVPVLSWTKLYRLPSTKSRRTANQLHRYILIVDNYNPERVYKPTKHTSCATTEDARVRVHVEERPQQLMIRAPP
jgi:hypothetical protein